jgi:hypothetical protein
MKKWDGLDILCSRVLEERADFTRDAEQAAGGRARHLHEFAGVVVIGPALGAPPLRSAGTAGVGEFTRRRVGENRLHVRANTFTFRAREAVQ